MRLSLKVPDGVRWSSAEEDMKSLLNEAFASSNRVTVLLAESIQERLLSFGLFEYLDVGPEEAMVAAQPS